MPAAQLAHHRSDGEPRSGRIADKGENANIERDLDHTGQIAKPGVKFQRAVRAEAACSRYRQVPYRRLSLLHSSTDGIPCIGPVEEGLPPGTQAWTSGPCIAEFIFKNRKKNRNRTHLGTIVPYLRHDRSYLELFWLAQKVKQGCPWGPTSGSCHLDQPQLLQLTKRVPGRTLRQPSLSRYLPRDDHWVPLVTVPIVIDAPLLREQFQRHAISADPGCPLQSQFPFAGHHRAKSLPFLLFGCRVLACGFARAASEALEFGLDLGVPFIQVTPCRLLMRLLRHVRPFPSGAGIAPVACAPRSTFRRRGRRRSCSGSGQYRRRSATRCPQARCARPTA